MAWVTIAVERGGEGASVDILPLGGRLELGDEKCGGSKRALCDRVRHDGKDNGASLVERTIFLPIG